MSTDLNRSFTFAVPDIKNLSSLGQKLSQPEDEVSKYLSGGFSDPARQSLSSWLSKHQDGDRMVADVVAWEFNGVVQGPLIYEEQRFAQVKLSDSARALHSRFRAKQVRLNGNDAQHFNQVLIKDSYPVEIWRIWLSDIEALKNPEDQDAWKEAYDVLWPIANRAARQGSGLPETDIQDIAAGAIEAIQRLLIKNLKPIESGRALIGMTARRSRWDCLSRMGKLDPLQDAEGIEESSDDDDNDETPRSSQTRPDDATIAPDELLCRIEDIEFLRRAFARLDDRQRALLQSREMDGKSYEELQQQFNLSSDQVGVYLKRAREKLKALFEEEREKPL